MSFGNSTGRDGLAFVTFVTLSLLLLAAAPTDARAADAAPRGEVELLVRGPDGRPAADREVRVDAAEPPFRGEPQQATVRTDAQGLVRFAWNAGVSRVKVSAAGVGYGVSGAFEVVPGKPVRAPLAPLVPWAVLEGTVPADVLGPGVELKSSSDRSWSRDPAVVPIGEGGRFRVEVPAGRWSLHTKGDKQRTASLGRQVLLAPGETAAGLTLKPLPAEERRASTQAYVEMRPGKGEKDATWAKGTVRDPAGKPVVGATVFAVAIYHGGIRMYELTKKVTTDAEGRFEIKGEGGLSDFSASIVAHAPGRPPAWAWIQGGMRGGLVPVGTPVPPPPPARTVDLVLPAAGGKLDVTVLRDGKPAAGVMVEAGLEGVNLRDEWAAGGGPERAEADAVVRPVRTTDADGVARFDALLPGRYRVSAVAGDEGAVRSLAEGWRGRPAGPYGIAEGVAVEVGRTTAHRMSVFAQPNKARLRVLRPDETPLDGKSFPYDYTSVARGGGWSSSNTVDRGDAVATFEWPGLWRAGFKYRDTPTTTIPLRDEPFYAADVVVAASSLLGADAVAPARVTARRMDPGSVVVELKDAAGKAVRGYVEVGQDRTEPVAVGATDEAGVVRFEGVPKWNYEVRAHVPGRPAADLAEYDAPMPDERLLTGTTAYLAEPVTVAPNVERRIVMRERPVGYVLGTLKPPAGHGVGEFAVYLNIDGVSRGPTIRYRQGTGELVAGPFPAGRVKLRIWHYGKDGSANVDCGEQEVAVEAGRVTRVELVPAAVPSPSPVGRGSQLLGVGGMSVQGSGALAGRVLLPGGKEPAMGAVVMYFEPKRWQPVLGGMTDATGAIRSKGLWFSGNAQPKDPPDDPPGPVVVALLPGSHGAAVVPPPGLGKPLEVVLPPAVTLRGKVTVGGKAFDGTKGTIRVLAAYEGKGKGRLAGALSVQATAQADGTFELAGLSPGRYTVQAALDDVWTSSSVSVDVTDKQPDAVTLAIGAPGGPVAVTVVDRDGKPAAGRAVTVHRPAGPLAEQLWPAEFTTDGAGAAWIPALEAGRHAVRVKGSDAVGEAVVAPLAEGKAAAVEVRLRVE